MLHALMALLLPFGQPVASQAPAGGEIVWRNIGPGGGGWIEAIACDPVRPGVLHVGCDVGGYYRSNDGGRSYRIQNQGLRDYFIESIAVCPADPRVIVLGGEGGIHKSTDDGQTWRWIREGFPEAQRYSFAAPVGCVAFDPNDTQVVYAGIGRPRWGNGGQGRIYRSDDQGESWSVCTEEGALPAQAIVSDLEIAPGLQPYILAATDHGLFRSEDGRAWGRVAELGERCVMEAAIAPSDPRVAYLTVRTEARDREPWDGGVWVSEDRGLTWERRVEGLADQVGRRSEPAPMTSSCKEVVVDPTDAQIAYVSDTAWVSAGIRKSTDGGRHWSPSAYRTETGGSYTEYGWITQWGGTGECMSISPTEPERVCFGTSGHIFSTGDAGATWEQRYCEMLPAGRFRGTGLEVTCLNDMVYDPHRAGRLYLGYFDIGLLISDDSGASFRRSVKGMRYDGNCFTVVPDPDDPQVLLATTGEWGANHGDVCRSEDGGESWQVVGKPETGLPDGQTKTLLLDPASPVGVRRLVVTCTGHGVYESTDGGANWHCVNGDLPARALEAPRVLVLAPEDGRHMWLAAAGSPATDAGVYETRDGGTTWVRAEGCEPLGDIQDLDRDPVTGTLYVCQRELYDRAVEPPVMRRGGVLRSTDGGASWVLLLEDRFANRLAISPLDPQVLYAGMTDHPYHDDSIAAGLLKSTDGGATWTAQNTDLSSHQVSCVALRARAAGGLDLVLGTGGNGAFVGVDSDEGR